MPHTQDILDSVDEILDEERRKEVMRQYDKVYMSSETAHPIENRTTAEEDQHEKDTRHVIAAAAYLIFLIPLLSDRNDPIYRYHAKQGLKVNIIEVIVAFTKPIFLTLGAALNSVLIISITSILSAILWAGVAIFILIGMYCAWTDQPLPDRFPGLLRRTGNETGEGREYFINR